MLITHAPLLRYIFLQASDELRHQLRNTPLDVPDTLNVTFGSSQTIMELHNWFALLSYFFLNLKWNEGIFYFEFLHWLTLRDLINKNYTNLILYLL